MLYNPSAIASIPPRTLSHTDWFSVCPRAKMVATNDIALVGDNKSVVVKRARPVGLKVSARPATARRVGRTCRNPACSKNPYFGWHGEKAIYCVTHKEPGE